MGMSNDAQILPTNPDELRQFATLLMSELKCRDLKITKLEHQLAGMRQHRFGSSSEALDQLKLALEEDEIAAAVKGAIRGKTTIQPKPPRKTSQSADLCPITCRAMKKCCHRAMRVANAAAS